MSRIFEALQRSEAERAGAGFPEPPSIATDLLRQAEQELVEQEAVVRTAAVMPAPAVPSPSSVSPGQHVTLGGFRSLHISPPVESRLISVTDRESLGAEKFRFLGVRLRQLRQTRPLKKVLITSTLPEEGKSTISTNLAATLARKPQQKILLLEGDLRRPVIAGNLGQPKLPGLTEWLKAKPGPLTNIYHLEGPGFYLLPAGVPADNPLELMQSGRLPGLIEELTARFDWIIIDSPPLLPLADTSLWSRTADGVLLVVREGKTEKEQLKRGLASLDSNNLLGFVVNNCTSTDHREYYSRYGPPAGGS
jgi:capsular exopolysaccharide synthesis family protein